MSGNGKITFGFQVAPSSDAATSDHDLYQDVIEDCKLGEAMGYEAAWLLEHHFSDYYPTPSPLLFMAHIAAACPDLGLGTSVLVLPWYHPLRIAEEISMVNTLTRGTLHLGIGRGTAKSEYDAYAIDMREARGRFDESYRIIEAGLTGEPFTFKGKYFDIPREIRIRPAPTGQKVNFYGAIGSPGSAAIMARLGLPPLCLAQFPDSLLAKILGNWRAAAEETGRETNVTTPIQVKCFIADTDAEARDLARKYLPRNFVVQAKHYEVDANPWEGIEDYAVFTKMFGNMRAMMDPDNLGPLIDQNLVGSPDTVARRVQAMNDLGFNYFLVSTAMPGTPKEVRREMYRRFAVDVAPRFDADFGKKPQAQAAD
ncbi:MAG: LLM class flavin-dependent oxidoreductase [Proteobacteria bacterium]|nr:LLM class flavin-dependent oxidoreductase [Pseudomonadota bacterium]